MIIENGKQFHRFPSHVGLRFIRLYEKFVFDGKVNLKYNVS